MDRAAERLSRESDLQKPNNCYRPDVESARAASFWVEDLLIGIESSEIKHLACLAVSALQTMTDWLHSRPKELNY